MPTASVAASPCQVRTQQVHGGPVGLFVQQRQGRAEQAVFAGGVGFHQALVGQALVGANPVEQPPGSAGRGWLAQTPGDTAVPAISGTAQGGLWPPAAKRVGRATTAEGYFLTAPMMSDRVARLSGSISVSGV